MFLQHHLLFQVIKHGDITCVGYTNMESRIAQTASSMFSGNITNFLMSMEDKKTKKWVIDHADPAVRSILCAQVLESDFGGLIIDLFFVS